MAKRKKAKSKSKARKSPARRARRSSKKHSPGKKVAAPSFGGKKFDCRGKKVRAGKSTKKVARVFCHRMKVKK